MNVINLNPVVQSAPAHRSSANELFDSQKIKLDSISSGEQANLQSRQKESLRIIRVAPDGLKVAEFGNNSRFASSSQSSVSNRPEEQYQINQQLLEREEIGQLVGVDIFA